MPTRSDELGSSPPELNDASEGPPKPAASIGAGAWVASTYFAEGFPYAIVNKVAPVLFEQLGLSLRSIGLTALFHIPWNLKLIWAPIIDQYATKRRWLIAFELALVPLLIATALLSSSEHFIGALSVLFVLIAAVSASHDVAIDGFYLECLDERGRARFVGLRAAFYRVALWAAGGGGVLAIANWQGWRVALLCMAGVMAALSAGHALWLPSGEKAGLALRQLFNKGLRFPLAIGAALVGSVAWLYRQGLLAQSMKWLTVVLFVSAVVLSLMRKRIQARVARSESYYARAFISFLAQPKVGIVLAFVALFRTGESFLGMMKWPFLHRSLDMSLGEYAWIDGTIGLAASIGATMLGGWLIARDGLRRWLWPFIVAQNLLNLLYVGLAAAAGDSAISLTTIGAVITFERFGEGLGTAVFMVYLMRCCAPEHKAAHFAIVTSLMSVSFTVAGATSGYLAEAVGYMNYFVLSLLATLPMMLLAFVVPHLDGREKSAKLI